VTTDNNETTATNDVVDSPSHTATSPAPEPAQDVQQPDDRSSESESQDTAAAPAPANGSSDSLSGPAQKPPQSEEDFELASDVEEYLRDVIDPELGINVVDLGLVYDIWIENGNTAVVNMTLTSPACPLTDMIEEQAAAAVMTHDLVEKLTINWVWMPPWGPQMITEEGREQLRALGFSV